MAFISSTLCHIYIWAGPQLLEMRNQVIVYIFEHIVNVPIVLARGNIKADLLRFLLSPSAYSTPPESQNYTHSHSTHYGMFDTKWPACFGAESASPKKTNAYLPTARPPVPSAPHSSTSLNPSLAIIDVSFEQIHYNEF